MRTERYVRLSWEEERTLREAARRGPKPEFRMRCLCMIMSHQRHNITYLAEYFKVTRQTIYGWMNAWQKKGLVGLYRSPGQGRK